MDRSGDELVTCPCGYLMLPPEGHRKFDSLADRALAARAAFEEIDLDECSSMEAMERLLSDPPIDQAGFMQITRSVALS